MYNWDTKRDFAHAIYTLYSRVNVTVCDKIVELIMYNVVINGYRWTRKNFLKIMVGSDEVRNSTSHKQREQLDKVLRKMFRYSWLPNSRIRKNISNIWQRIEQI